MWLDKNGFVYLNGKELILVGVDIQRDNHNFGPVTVPEDSFFMLGDNRGISRFSIWGFVPKSDLIGQSLFTIWPLNRIRWIRYTS